MRRRHARTSFIGKEAVLRERLYFLLIDHPATAGRHGKNKNQERNDPFHSRTSLTLLAPNEPNNSRTSSARKSGSFASIHKKNRVWLASLKSGALKTG